MSIGIEIKGERKVELQFEEFPEQLRAKLVQRVRALTDELAAEVRGLEPTRTGALRSETASFLSEGETYVRGNVRVTEQFAKAAALEYGAHKPTKVKEHTSRLDHVFDRLVGPMTVVVSAYTRTPNIAAHDFLRGPLEAMSGQILAALEEAVQQASDEAAS